MGILAHKDVLVCCPNLTVKEPLQVLRPENPGNYYAAFDLVPVNLRPHLQAGKVLVENWQRQIAVRVLRFDVSCPTLSASNQ